MYSTVLTNLPEGSRMYFLRQKPSSVMKWATVASDGSKSSLTFTEKKLMGNCSAYVKMLEYDVFP